MAKEELVYVGIKGQVLALNQATGETLWATKLPTGMLGGLGFVHLVVDGDCIFATTQGESSCLDPVTGKIRWHNPLKGYGLGIASVATPKHNSPVNLAAQSVGGDTSTTA